jgi:hypothetical protein
MNKVSLKEEALLVEDWLAGPFAFSSSAYHQNHPDIDGQANNLRRLRRHVERNLKARKLRPK